MNDKRQKDLARAKAQRQAARAAARARRKRSTTVTAIGLALLLVAGLFIGGVLRSAPSQDPDVAASASPSGPSSSASAAPVVAGCQPAGAPRQDNMSFTSFDPKAADDISDVVLDTNCGSLTITLDPKSPKTNASIAYLSKAGFYNNTACHRLTTAGIFVVQCGDPAGNGTGGPGYSIPEENLPSINANGVAVYPRGTVAMARRSDPGSGGSQFFLVFQDSPLPPDYTVFGRISAGLDVLDRVAAVGTADGSSDGLPGQPLFIRSATLKP